MDIINYNFMKICIIEMKFKLSNGAASNICLFLKKKCKCNVDIYKLQMYIGRASLGSSCW